MELGIKHDPNIRSEFSWVLRIDTPEGQMRFTSKMTLFHNCRSTRESSQGRRPLTRSASSFIADR